MKAEIRRHNRRLNAADAKADQLTTHEKIQLGGLIKKAGLAREPTAVLFGLLLEAAELLSGEQGSTVRARWRLKGDIVFTRENAEKEERRRLLRTSY